MSYMSGKYFADTNILIYAFDIHELEKQKIAQQLLDSTVVSSHQWSCHSTPLTGPLALSEGFDFILFQAVFCSNRSSSW